VSLVSSEPSQDNLTPATFPDRQAVESLASTPMNYFDTFIQIAPDCPVQVAVVPAAKGGKVFGCRVGV